MLPAIALAQVNPTVGDIRGNLQLCRSYLEKIGRKAEVVVFPEGVLPGYPAQDLLLERAFLRDLDENLKELAAGVDHRWVIVGTVRREGGERSSSSSSGGRRRLFNTAAVLHDGEIVAYRDKTLLPTYDVFDEARYFTPADSIEPVTLTLASGERLRVGLQICEDLWDTGYDIKVSDRLGEQGIDLFINISASPFRSGSFAERHDLIRAQAKKWGKPFVYCNLVGGQDELVFDGRSLVFDEAGDLRQAAASFEEELLLVHFPLDTATAAATTPGREAELAAAIKLGLRDYFVKTGHARAVVGLSGGIDSSVVATLAAQALGPENVTGIAMPTTYSSSHSLEDAETLAKALGIHFQVLPIEHLRTALLEALAPFFAGTEPGVAEENLQARIRGNLLMAVGNKQGALLLTTGNKTELALGYATLYGDMCGALAPIGDLSKTEVYAVARCLNSEAGRSLIPRRVLAKPPSAELKPDQVDPFDYEIVSPLVDELVINRAGRAELLALGYEEGLIRHIRGLTVTSEYKRRQAAPVIRVTGKAFGVGRRYPIVNRYEPVGKR